MEVRDILLITVVVFVFLVIGIGIALNAYTTRQEETLSTTSGQEDLTPTIQPDGEQQRGSTLGIILGALGIVLIIVTGVGLNIPAQNINKQEEPSG
jgi:hypothetical protein